MVLLTNSPTNAKVETLTPSTFLALRREPLENLMYRHTGLATRVRRELKSSLAETCVVNA